jgi:fluoride exporter
MKEALFIGVAGFFGSIARYLIGEAFRLLQLTEFPLATLVVNLVGSFFIGLIWTLVEKPFSGSEALYYYGGIGFLGAFTTFSAFAGENFILLKQGNWPWLFLNVSSNLILGILAVFLGRWLVLFCR